MSADECVSHIEATVQRLLRDVAQLPFEVLYREPAVGEWPVMSTLAHVAELLPFWAHQAADLAASPGSNVGRALDDPRRVEPIEQHRHDSLQAIIPQLRAGLEECLKTLRAIPTENWTVTGQHPSRGTMSVEQLVQAFLSNHVDEHARQIDAALAALGGAQSSQVP